MWRKPTYRRWRLAVTGLALLVAGGLLPVLILPAAQASPNYDNQNPVQAGCTNGAQDVSDNDSITVNELRVTVQIQSSAGCPYGLWVRVSAASGVNRQYKAVVSLTRSTLAGSVTQEEVIGGEPFVSNMLGDENSCVTVTVLVESLNGEAESTTQDELCNQGFPAATVTETSQPTGTTRTSAPTQTSVTTTGPGSSTTTTTTVTTTSGGGWVVRTEETITMKAGVVVSKSIHRSRHRKMKRRRRHKHIKPKRKRSPFAATS